MCATAGFFPNYFKTSIFITSSKPAILFFSNRRLMVSLANQLYLTNRRLM